MNITETIQLGDAVEHRGIVVAPLLVLLIGVAGFQTAMLIAAAVMVVIGGVVMMVMGPVVVVIGTVAVEVMGVIDALDRRRPRCPPAAKP